MDGSAGIVSKAGRKNGLDRAAQRAARELTAQQVLSWFLTVERPLLLREAAAALADLPPLTVRHTIRRLVFQGKLIQAGRGNGARVGSPLVMAGYRRIPVSNRAVRR